MPPIEGSSGVVGSLWISVRSASEAWYTMLADVAPTSTPMRARESHITSCFQ